MALEIPTLPYSADALEPHLSRETIDLHYGKHTKKYFDTANALAKGTIFASDTLDDVSRDRLLRMGTALFNNVSQAWNHAFYWNGLAPVDSVGSMSDQLVELIEAQFLSVDTFTSRFTEQATNLFGSGWTWLVWKDDRLQIKNTPNSGTPLTDAGSIPLLACDVWEHAYLYDTQYAANRPEYIRGWWKVVNWNVVNLKLVEALK